MSEVTVRRLDESGLKPFVMLPFRLYRNDPNWVAPLIKDQLKTLKYGSGFLKNTEHAFLMGYREGKPCARAIVGKYKGMKEYMEGSCYFSLPEAADPEAFKTIMDAVEGWARERGLLEVTGPWSPTDGEDDRCFLIKGFDGPPTLMGTYNFKWYAEEIEKLGYVKGMDLYTFLLTEERSVDERISRALELALKRSRMEVSHLNSRQPMDDFRDMHEIIRTCAATDPEFPNPNWEQFLAEARRLSKLADERLIWIARRIEDGKPAAFVVCMPNWSEVLMKMHGRLFPIGWIYAIGAKRRIKGMRALMQFCVPEYRGSGIMSVLTQRSLKRPFQRDMNMERQASSKTTTTNPEGRLRPLEASITGPIGGTGSRCSKAILKTCQKIPMAGDNKSSAFKL